MINGYKRWIRNGTIADVVVLWARDEADRQAKGFLVERGAPGCDARVIGGKGSMSTVWQADIDLTGVRIPAKNQLPATRSFADIAAVRNITRALCAWAALGHPVTGYDAALSYAGRVQSGKPLAGFQLAQDRLVKRPAKVSAMQFTAVGSPASPQAGGWSRRSRARQRRTPPQPRGTCPTKPATP